MAVQSSDKKINLIINKLTRTQYESLKRDGRINEDELYFVTEDNQN